jgi:hypothetical protein
VGEGVLSQNVWYTMGSSARERKVTGYERGGGNIGAARPSGNPGD